MALRSDIFQRNSLSGTTTVRNGFANVVVDIGPYGLTGNINFIVQLRRGSEAGEVLVETPPINIVDYSELISFEPNVAIISEGEDVRFDLLTANVPDGSTFYYTANAVAGNVDAEDFISEITGSIVVYDNQANILISSNAIPTTAVETGEIFDIQLRLGSVSGEVSRTSNTVEILDIANVVGLVSITASDSSIIESESTIFTIDTVNALGTNSAVLYYTVTGNADIYSDTSGSLLISGNQANLELIAEASVSEDEVRQFTLEIRRGSISGTILGTNTVDVSPYSIAADSKISGIQNAILKNTGDIFFNSNVEFDVKTFNVTSNETFYYSVLGASNTQIVGGNTNSFVVETGNTSTNITIQLSLPNEQANLSLQFFRELSGPVLLQSNVFNLSIIPAIGGTVIDEGDFITHIFTESGNLEISSYYNLTSNILMVGGGGGGSAGPYTSVQGGGGGGGAGGLILREGAANAAVLFQGNTYSIVVGGGGNGGSPPSGPGTPGANTEAFGMIALGGGRGRTTGYFDSSSVPGNPAMNGGTGGGAGVTSNGRAGQVVGGGLGEQTTSLGIPAESRLYGYGKNGGSARDNTSTNGGGGGAGANGGNYSNGVGGDGIPVAWVPSDYGTTGPAPGRWFAGGGASNAAAGGAGGGGGGPNSGVTTPNTGGGGKGGPPSGSNAGTVGAPGVVIIRYPKP